MGDGEAIPFAALAAEVARRLLGEPNGALSTRKELRYGTRGSLSIEIAGPKAGTWYDHEQGHGGGIIELIGRETGRINGEAIDWLREQKLADPAPTTRKIVATYDYTDAAGRLLYQVVRFEPKGFRQRHRDEAGDWIWNMRGVERVLYRLPAVTAAPTTTIIWVVEGEKSADALGALGLVATSSPGGAGKWSPGYNPVFAGRHVVVLPDNDPAGAAHAAQVAEHLAGVVASVRVLSLPNLPPRGDVCDWLASGGDAATLTALAAEAPLATILAPTPPEPDDPGNWEGASGAPPPWPDDAPTASPVLPVSFPLTPIDQIPPRRWAYGTFLMFGQAAVLGAVDGGGKGAIATGIALSFVTGRPLLGERVWRPGPVAILTYEDDQTEWQRRIAAACIIHGIDYLEAIQQIFLIVAAGRSIRLAAMAGGRTIFPDGDGVVRAIRHYGCALTIVDPVNHTHDLQDGNSNALVAQLAAEITRIAAEADTALLALHHLRKGSTGQADDLMGATSLRATFRAARILQRMDAETAEWLDLDEGWRYTRIAGTKENYAPPPERGTWFKLESQDLGNAAGIYENGDNVAVAVPWAPPSPFEGLSWEQAIDALDAIDRGLPSGEKYTASRRGRVNVRWAGSLLVEAGRADAQAAAILKAWLAAGVLTEESYRSPIDRHETKGLFVDPGKLAEMRREGGTSAPPAAWAE